MSGSSRPTSSSSTPPAPSRGDGGARPIAVYAADTAGRTNLAVAYCALTDQCEAEGIEAARAAIDLDRQLGQLDHLAVPLIVLGQIDPAHALESYREALGLVEAAGEPQLLFPCYDGLATLHLDLGEQTEAEPYLTLAQTGPGLTRALAVSRITFWTSYWTAMIFWTSGRKHR